MRFSFYFENDNCLIGTIRLKENKLRLDISELESVKSNLYLLIEK